MPVHVLLEPVLKQAQERIFLGGIHQRTNPVEVAQRVQL
jgi:hypothetical protein